MLCSNFFEDLLALNLVQSHEVTDTLSHMEGVGGGVVHWSRSATDIMSCYSCNNSLVGPSTKVIDGQHHLGFIFWISGGGMLSSMAHHCQ